MAAAPEPAPAAPAVELYSYWRSSSSYRVRIALALKGIAYEYRAVHLLREGGQQLKPEYAALNPMKEVPTLLIDGLTLTQSNAMCEYLEETRPEPPLLPSDAAARAHVRAICAVISNDIQPVCNLRVLKHVQALVGEAASKEEREAARDAWVRKYIAAGFEGAEALLARSAGRYSCGDVVTLADIFLLPQVYNAVRFGVSLEPYPTLARVAAALEEHPAFAAAHPSRQPDAEA